MHVALWNQIRVHFIKQPQKTNRTDTLQLIWNRATWTEVAEMPFNSNSVISPTLPGMGKAGEARSLLWEIKIYISHA